MQPPIDHSVPMVPYAFAKQHGLLCVAQQGEVKLFCRPNCTPQAFIEARRISKSFAQFSVTEEDAFNNMLQAIYHENSPKSLQQIESLEEDVDLSGLAAALPEKEDVLNTDSEAPVIRMINALLREALQQKASDIHLETFEKNLVVRFRVDGVLREVLRLKRSLSSLLISRIKIMAKLDIAEKRLPQDGHITLKSANYEFDVRVSTIPGPHAERLVLRLLDKEAEKLNFVSLGMSERDITTIREIIKQPHGIVLVTGPTGSGKTTTLYSALLELNDGHHSILTIEDPIEVNLDGVGQTEVNMKIDMSFARGLRAILRQDPDIIMVGEIRDLETAEIAVQASLTGHLVFSTLHTNSAVGAVTRLYDMNVEPYLLSSSLIGLVAQRLVRRLCKECRVAAPAQPHEYAVLRITPETPVTIYHPKGCEACQNIGYKGRIGIYEIIRIDQEMRRLIHDRASEHQLEAYARQHNPSIMDDARSKILAGETSISEIKRVIE